jgi:ketosteroid isomerase-like protein
MRHQDVELVRRFTQSVANGDHDDAVRCLHDEGRWDWSESIAPFRGVYVGHEGLRRFFAESQETWDEFAPRIDEVIDYGDGRLVTLTTVSAHARDPGIQLQARAALLWTVRDGKIVEAKLFQTADDALQAAGRGE